MKDPIGGEIAIITERVSFASGDTWIGRPDSILPVHPKNADCGNLCRKTLCRRPCWKSAHAAFSPSRSSRCNESPFVTTLLINGAGMTGPAPVLYSLQIHGPRPANSSETRPRSLRRRDGHTALRKRCVHQQVL